MNHTFASTARPIDIATITSTIKSALATAGLQTDSGPIHGVTETIRRALSSAGLSHVAAGGDGSIVEVTAREVDARQANLAVTGRFAVNDSVGGQFVARQFRNQAGTRAYKLYVPSSLTSEPMPLIVMLHGCTQSADDFAAGTQMNQLAEQHGFIVVYPEQAPNANGSKCWNWFKPQDQARDSGEPSLIAGITREVAANYPVDPGRIYVAGLSAGAAMAVILGEVYPELYAGIGAHSGLPYAAAHDMPSAFAAMGGSRGAMPELTNLPSLSNLPGAVSGARKKATHFVPTIVFHGDQDHTVGKGNGVEILQQATAALALEAAESPATSTTQSGTASGGRGYSRTVYANPQGRSQVESWIVHGAGHAWSGGHASGSYTDVTGPDASAEMVRFFLSQPSAAAVS
jgi:poly(hydroxyalkanoate) depolymerase family esterase